MLDDIFKVMLSERQLASTDLPIQYLPNAAAEYLQLLPKRYRANTVLALQRFKSGIDINLHIQSSRRRNIVFPILEDLESVLQANVTKNSPTIQLRAVELGNLVGRLRSDLQHNPHPSTIFLKDDGKNAHNIPELSNHLYQNGGLKLHLQNAQNEPHSQGNSLTIAKRIIAQIVGSSYDASRFSFEVTRGEVLIRKRRPVADVYLDSYVRTRKTVGHATITDADAPIFSVPHIARKAIRELELGSISGHELYALALSKIFSHDYFKLKDILSRLCATQYVKRVPAMQRKVETDIKANNLQIETLLSDAMQRDWNLDNALTTVPFAAQHNLGYVFREQSDRVVAEHAVALGVSMRYIDGIRLVDPVKYSGLITRDGHHKITPKTGYSFQVSSKKGSVDIDLLGSYKGIPIIFEVAPRSKLPTSIEVQTDFAAHTFGTYPVILQCIISTEKRMQKDGALQVHIPYGNDVNYVGSVIAKW